MKINLKPRFKNKVFVLSVITLIVSVVYKFLALFEVVPNISEYEVLEVFGCLVDVLAFIGVLVDPTTEGFNDSDRAMTYYTDEDVREEE